MGRLNFILQAEASQSQARAGIFTTLHGEVKTPVFMPVGTQATVKNQSFSSLKSSGSQVLLANTYHLMLRPGVEVFKKFGGIHSFMNWQGSVLTDSGGFQIFSLPHSRLMSEEGAEFRSYVDGRRILLTPEVSIATQKAIGSDIMMVLDQCIPSTSDHSTATHAMHLTHRWAERSLQARGDSPQALFGIIQGALFEDLRRQSADFLSQLPFEGLAIGGLAVGESKQQREDFTEMTTRFMPRHLPRYMMGVGTPSDLLEAVHRGVDMFDCIIPTAYAYRGVAFTSIGRMQLRRSVFKFSENPLDSQCLCPTCSTYSRAYLHHLVKTEEALGWQLIGAHNIFFYHQLMREIRQSIFDNTFSLLYQAKKQTLGLSEEEHPIIGPKSKRRRWQNSPELTLGRYDVHTSPQGISHIRHLASGEMIHPQGHPIVEANHLYIEQSNLVQRLKKTEEYDRPLVIWDVGLGAGTNAMAAIHCYEKTTGPLLPLHIYSFENNLDSLKLAMKHAHTFTYLRHGGPQQILQNGFWKSKSLALNWNLLMGDFLQEMSLAPAPDLIFFDPFSPMTDPSLWTYDCFKKLAIHCSNHPTSLYTYSASTAVRAGLLAAGFFVGHGVATGPKETTTSANTVEAEAKNPLNFLLGREWLERWEKSHAKYPSDIGIGIGIGKQQILEFELLIRQHQQFRPMNIFR